MKKTSILSLFFGLSFWTQALACDPNLQPIIGIPAQPLNQPDYPPTNFIAASYVKFVEMFGGRVVPVLPNQNDSYYKFLAARLNGVIFPGGESSIYSGVYHDLTKFFYNYSINLADRKNEKFPVLGICLGFEALVTFAAKDDEVLSQTDSDNYLSSMEFSKYGREDSDLFSAAPDWLIVAIENAKITSNFHLYSLLKETYDANTDIQKIFNVVSYSYSRDNLKYVAIVESKKYPLLAIQHHPEKNLFEWTPTSNYAHSFLGSTYAQYIGDYFIQTCRTSCQSFDSEEQLGQYLIYNYPVTYSQGTFVINYTQMYLFSANQTL